MTQQEMEAEGRRLSTQAGASESLHRYFVKAVPRLHHSCEFFGLFDRPLGDVLEIGPFFGYVPFFLRPRASSYTVLEGNDPVVYPLQPIYEQHQIDFRLIDLFDLFGPTADAPHALPLASASFDTILCWETMEHFNFNPVKFVRELHRLLKPGGRACITVPNRAAVSNLANILGGVRELGVIDAYYTYEDYESNGKKCFYGFHWREYTPHEFGHLFARAGFAVKKCVSHMIFHGGTNAPLWKRTARGLFLALAPLLPRFGGYVYLLAEKPPESS